MNTDYYKVLGIFRDASDETIRKSYRKLALQFHPDKNSDANAEKFKEIRQAYGILSNKEERNRFDRLEPEAGIYNNEDKELEENTIESRDEELEGGVYYVEEILKIVFANGEKFYRVKWRNYEEKSWVHHNEVSCDLLIEKYFEKKGNRKIPTVNGASPNEREFN